MRAARHLWRGARHATLAPRRVTPTIPATTTTTLDEAIAKLEADLAVAQRQVAQLSRQEARMRELFGDSTKTFREAVRCLFGYRADMQAAAPGSSKGSLIVLRPDGAAAKGAAPPGDRDPQLQFRFAPAAGRLELLPTALSKSLAREVAQFIERDGSVPAFTANLTMDLFQRAAAAGGR